jgi:hypothetical protein
VDKPALQRRLFELGCRHSALAFLVGLSALCAAPFVVVASASGRRADSVQAGVLVIALLTPGAVILLAQAWAMGQRA